MYIVLLAIYHLCGIVHPQIDMFLSELSYRLNFLEPFPVYWVKDSMFNYHLVIIIKHKCP